MYFFNIIGNIQQQRVERDQAFALIEYNCEQPNLNKIYVQKEQLSAYPNQLTMNSVLSEVVNLRLLKPSNLRQDTLCMLETIGQIEQKIQKLQSRVHLMNQDQITQIKQRVMKQPIQHNNLTKGDSNNDEVKVLTEKISELETYNKLLNQTIQKLTNQNDQLKTNKHTAQYQLKGNQQFQKMNVQLDQIKYWQFFDGVILQNNIEYKKYLKQEIEKYFRLNILKTRKLFSLELANPSNNFHQYVDQIPHIVVIIKTKKGACFAGYSQSPISREQQAKGKGMLISLNNKLTFNLIENKPSVAYKDYFLIMGKSEIQIKVGSWTVYSNFGIMSGCFNSRGFGVNDLLGEGQITREVELDTFQIHKVMFE